MDDSVGGRLISPTVAGVQEGPLLRMPHTDGGETSRRTPLNIKPWFSHLVYNIIYNTGRENLNQFLFCQLFLLVLCLSIFISLKINIFVATASSLESNKEA